MKEPRRVVILGAAGRDFHNFNLLYRDDPSHRVVAFTATQIPDIAGRRYPPELAGTLYAEGIPIFEESELPRLIRELDVDVCLFAYSDVPYARVMALSAIANAGGADFLLAGPKRTQLTSRKPVISVVATRTGAGKSPACRHLGDLLAARGLKVVTVRHPMPYGNLAEQAVQRFASLDDLARHHCTVEEREEYELHIARGSVVYAGVDYTSILEAAENDPAGCDVILWDGGNNDFPFYRADLTITIADPHRAGDELAYYPGEVNLRMADAVIINKVDSAPRDQVEQVLRNVAKVNPAAGVIEARSRVTADDPAVIAGKRVLVIEDGPTLTHGGMTIGAGSIAAHVCGAAEVIDPRPYAVGSLRDTFSKYPHLERALPAMGYGEAQLRDLAATVAACPCDAVVIGTPVDLGRLIDLGRPSTRVRYELEETGPETLPGLLDDFLARYTENR
ncbi:MAG: cyclic 2,3-diphosphoglycerate synthase [Zoogloeaceae bacterium]|nr:cyclic 2,3-diphosphoglycerate synthase [Zoogloeaceae bacterium]